MVVQSVPRQRRNHQGGLLFVNSSHPDDIKEKCIQHSIRSHSIRGALRAQPSRRKRPLAVTYTLEKVNSNAEYEMSQDYADRTQAAIAKSLVSWPFPGELQPRAQELMYFMSAESDYVFRPFRTVWFSMARTDATAFQLCMANAAMFMAQRKHPDTYQYEQCSEVLEYYGKCLGQITRRLECRDDCTSEGVIVTVLGLICHDIYVGLWSRWAIHIRGLQRIIQLSGGHERIDSNLALWASWYDVMGSAVQDKPPQFSEYMCRVLPSCQPARTPLLERITRRLIDDDDLTLGLIADALEKTRYVVLFVNDHSQDPEFWRHEDDLSPLHTIGPATHILLSIPRINAKAPFLKPTEIVREMARLAMLILLAALKQMYSFSLDEIEISNLTAKFAAVLLTSQQNPLTGQFEKMFCHLQLWALFTVAVLQPFADRSLYVVQIRRCMRHLKLKSATDAFQPCRDIAWLDAIGGTEMENKSLLTAIDSKTPPP